jgi:hypothetical protein
MIANLQLQLRFKGARTYVQGPDIHDTLCDALAGLGIGPLEKIDITCHRLVSTNVTVRELAPGESPEEGTHAVFRYTVGGESHTLVLNENGETITIREPYDEPALVAAMTLDEESKSISIAPPEGVSNAELVVALNKEMLTRCFPEAKGKWLFARLQLAQNFRPLRFNRIEVRFLGHSNFRITRSALFGDGQPVGSLFFSLLPSA